MVNYESTKSDRSYYGSISIQDEWHEVDPLLRDTASPYESSSWWSQLVFGWMSPLFELGNIKQQLQIKDFDTIPLPETDTTSHVKKTFDQAWSKERLRAAKKNQEPSLARALWMAFSYDFCKAGVLKLIHDLLQFVGPQVLRGLIVFIRDPDAPLWHGVALTLIVTAAQLLMSLCLRHYFFQCYQVGLRVRSAMVTAIYQKALRVTNRQDKSIGEITNLMSVDAQRLQDTIVFLHAIWYSLLQIGLALYFLWNQLGPSCLTGVAVIFASIPLTAMTAMWMRRSQKKLMSAKDKRIEVINEVLGNMKVIKLQAWEIPFRDKLERLRSAELTRLFQYSIGRIVSGLTWSAVPLMISLGTFATYVLTGHPLDVASALTALALFDILRFPLFMLPNAINSMVEAGVALGRVNSFLSFPEQPVVSRGSLGDVGIEISDATFVHDSKRPKANTAHVKDPQQAKLLKDLSDAEWERKLFEAQLARVERHLAQLEGRTYEDAGNADILSLCRINFSCRRGEFVAVVGGVGSGKSTFLKALLGEVTKIAGDIAVNGSLAYFPQSPYIMNDTVKGNIMFGNKEEHPELYEKAISACALNHDLDLLPHGDMCEIGEKGITLSGGQKARISMARVVYHDADICLLDDPLAAVDANVGRHLFEQCILDVLLRGKGSVRNKDKKRTVILATNALQYLSHPLVDRIVVLKDGSVVETGTYKELTQEKDSHFSSFLFSFNKSISGRSTETESEEGCRASKVTNTSPDAADKVPQAGDSPHKEATETSPIEKPALMTDEMQERAVGKVDASVYFAWAQAAGGIWVVGLVLASYALVESMNLLSKWWLTHWSHNGGEGDAQMHYLAIYGIINVSAIMAGLGRSFIFMLLSLRASRKLFLRVLDGTLKAPMSFFDTTPVGRIVNRFSKDIYTVDEALPDSCKIYIWMVFEVLSTLVVVCWVTPIFAVALVPIVIFYRKQQMNFTLTYRELKRLDSVNRSPIYALFGGTLDGVSTIRAFSAEQSLFERMLSMVDLQQHAYFLTCSGLCWLAVRLELVGTIIIFTACLASVFHKGQVVDLEAFAGLAGLSISYALSVTQSLNWAVRMGSDFEANMVAVERLEQYSVLPAEAPHETESDLNLPPEWPDKGVIEFSNSKLRYRAGLPLVLKGLNLTLPSHSKIGVVGRTGAGKSTLMAALLRLVELDEGMILIDGVDIRTLGLRKLRSKIAVIPQDPILFTGTVKSNLDPFDLYPTEKLQEALRRVELWNDQGSCAVSSLSDPVSEGGSNFSVGQRQLLVIARALLCGAGVVICDEATAAVDGETDARIQRVLKLDFAHASCITVAHRLNTILDSDYILVMHNGQAAEFDTPSNLLKQKDGMFKQLVDTWEEEHGTDTA